MTAIEEVRRLVSLANRFDSAQRGAPWNNLANLAAVVDEARAVVESDDLDGPDDPAFAAAHAARVATARAIVAMAENPPSADAPARKPPRIGNGHSVELQTIAARVWAGLLDLPRRMRGELRHVVAEKPHSILLRLVITLGISVGMVAFYEFSGWSNYTAAQLMLYLYSAMIGSVVCTNALCFEAGRTRLLLWSGERVWRILVVKNLTMIGLMSITGIPAIALLALGPSDLKLIPLIDQFLVMMFTWTGIANVLSVVSPLRQEPVSARLKDGTWLPYLVSFGVSYGVGLTVNLIIFWQLWARQAASNQITGGTWAAFVLVLMSAIVLWLLLTVFAAACIETQELRRAVDREMIVYRKT
ncbi:ABC transporter permease [Gordonia sp. TBRC 11910]|uniref:ABC transporter permease n=1 Tax=Gordonia asplenii TaxID=2725283 RepID=A0A848KTH3_9ACTN|nr:ABC transporter permease [Gordonia asplenii]NMO01996.1 ABC transporter permease [Gordonia asplenii]